MYVRTVRMEHLKRIQHLELAFTTARGKPRMWTVLIGENGTAKTSILQGIAMAAAGWKGADGLAGAHIGHLRDRRSDDPLVVEADFEFSDRGQARDPDIHPLLDGPLQRPSGRLGLRSWVRVEKGSTGVEGGSVYLIDGTPAPEPADPLRHARDRKPPFWFVIAYGVFRSLPEPSAQPQLTRPGLERLEPLFNARKAMTSTSFATHFHTDQSTTTETGRKAKARLYHRVLKRALLSVRSLLPDIEDVELRGQGGVVQAGDLLERDRFEQRMGRERLKLPGVALSHGYQSMIAWIADLVGHVILEADSELDPRDMEGLVLIDEIDLYLHPRWQVAVVPALRETFPKMQFICTTHSPLVLAGLNPDEVVRLGPEAERGDIVPLAFDPSGQLTRATGQAGLIHPDPRPMTGSELYRLFFGLEGLTPLDKGTQLRRVQLLAGDPYRSDEEDAELRRTSAALQAAGFQVPRPSRRRT